MWRKNKAIELDKILSGFRKSTMMQMMIIKDLKRFCIVPGAIDDKSTQISSDDKPMNFENNLDDGTIPKFERIRFSMRWD